MPIKFDKLISDIYNQVQTNIEFHEPPNQIGFVNNKLSEVIEIIGFICAIVAGFCLMLMVTYSGK
jgi:hypothetical protein